MKSFANLYLCTISQDLEIFPLTNADRQREIEKCSNEKVKREKYAVFKLFQYALKDAFNEDFSDKAYKDDKGKWKVDGVEFSFSHADGVVAVLFSDEQCGVDIEKVERFLDKENLSMKLENKVLSAEELSKLWTKKESAFKCLNKERFDYKKVDLEDKKIKTFYQEFFGKQYCISVCGESIDNLIIKTI